MKTLIFAIAFAFAGFPLGFVAAALITSAVAQVPLDQVDQALSVARMAAANEAGVKEARIIALTKELSEIKAKLEAAEKTATCKQEIKK